MGEVYRATDTRLDRAVAVKIISTSIGDRPDAPQCFEAWIILSPLHYNALQCLTKEWLAMQDQITVRLPPDLSAALRRAARQLRRRNSDVVRMALEAFLHAGEHARRKPAERVRGLIGSLNSGVPDLAERHREYLIKTLKRGR
jgi:Arc/MetJ-type ribon-helix-helix transcriptional regulator